MTPQDEFMILAPLRPGAADAARALIASMTLAPGLADPTDPRLPLGEFDTLHVARMLVLDDPTLADRGDGFAPPPSLAVMGFCDGAAEAFLPVLAARGDAALRALFAHCVGFEEGSDLLGWMRAHRVKPSIRYVNWLGRTVRQVREEAALHAVLATALARLAPGEPAAIETALHDAVTASGLPLSPEASTPPAWRIRELLHFFALPVAAALLLVPLLLALPLLIVALRSRERRDAVIVPRPSPKRLAMLSTYEDHDVTNPFSAIGSLKPGRFRLWLTVAILFAVDWTARHIFTRGRLARVGTIHFARWSLIDGGRRLFFASNYDGSLESYMDDFINKVAFGLNLVFSNGIGYPRTDWLVIGGARREQDFKSFLRHHQMPTDLWYKAYPGLSTYDLARNGRIRAGFEQGFLDDAARRRWLAEI